MKSRAPSPRRRQSGFALLITITLLAFLVLLLVSLAALTRVETQVAANNQQLSQARQNALMALNIGLGRLQETAGPDTRVTATGDIVANRNVDKKHWTGVWDTTATGADKNIGWLVSGTAPAGSPGVGTVLAAGPENSLVELVGGGSTDVSADDPANNRVRVETVPIKAPGIPGQDPLTETTIGNYAYWVGDEGVKAKVSVTDPWADPFDETLAALIGSPPLMTKPEAETRAETYRFVAAQRNGIEGVDAVDGTPIGDGYAASDTVFKAALPKLLTLAQMPLASTGIAGQVSLAAARQNRFHDLTVDSVGLLTNVVSGGFKKDLSAWVATSSPASPALNDLIIEGASSDTSKYGLPKWGLLHNYARTLENGNTVPPRQQTATQQGVYPVLTYARIGYNVSCPAATEPYKVHIMPIVALWNPYNVPIAAHTYEVCFAYVSAHPDVTDDTKSLRLGFYFQGQPSGAYFFPETLRVGSTPYGTGTGAQREFWRFKIHTKRLEPGEIRLYTIDPAFDGLQYQSGVTTLSDTTVAPDNSVFVQGSPLSTAQLAANTYWYTLPEHADVSKPQVARMEILLTEPPPSGLDVPQTNAALRDYAYQRILGTGMFWLPNTGLITIPPENTGVPLIYQRIELTMSTLPVGEAHQFYRNPQSTPRWLAMINPQAAISLRKPLLENNPSPTTQRQLNYNLSYLTEDYINNPAPACVYREPPQTDNGYVSAGTRVSTTGAAQRLVVREFQPADAPLFSLAQLQHANVATLNVNPPYTIGNSLANLYVPRSTDDAMSPELITDSFATTPDSGFPDNGTFNRIYDLSYLLNKTLWDDYFFSTVPDTLQPEQALSRHYRLPNARYQFNWRNGSPTSAEYDGVKTIDNAAAHLLVNGGFNANSTSEQAWRALLHSHNGIETAPNDKTHVFSRFSRPLASAEPNATWLGYRILSDQEINALAAAIVAEIRLRGPSLSLAEFINRRLAADDTGLKGPLQAAIDNASLAAVGNLNNIAPFNNGLPADTYPRDVKDNLGYNYPHSGDPEQQVIYLGGTSTTSPSASRAAFAPGYLTQADLLTALGPILTVRSDTFRIRAYGDSVNPTTGAVDGRAWCEAIVQRLPDYVDPGDDVTASPGSLNPTNQTFGRRFKIVSFRWLASHEI